MQRKHTRSVATIVSTSCGSLWEAGVWETQTVAEILKGTQSWIKCSVCMGTNPILLFVKKRSWNFLHLYTQTTKWPSMIISGGFSCITKNAVVFLIFHTFELKVVICGKTCTWHTCTSKCDSRALPSKATCFKFNRLLLLFFVCLLDILCLQTVNISEINFTDIIWH